MKKCYLLLLILLTGFVTSRCMGQKKDSTWVGSVRGVVGDSEHNTLLRAATVAIYWAKDSSLIGYRLTNNYGEFEYVGLPCDKPLKLIATYIGYKSSTKFFSIPLAKNNLNVGHVDLTVATNELDEVIISSGPPPVQMKGDTLEFNASAFKLDPNAQTEDLLKILPGITIWSDGIIMVNGREIKSVLVNGKPFFGVDARIATQNIPKSVVDKIQIYQKDKDPKKLTDSTSEMNIKLKKGKGIGYFGKFSGGYGTEDHYEGDGNLNFFNGRTQLGLVLSSNNVNKVANDINFMLRNNTFKGNGVNVEYQSNFETEGVNKFMAGGLIFQHDLINNPDYYNSNRFTALYFAKNNQQDLFQQTLTTTTLNNGAFFKQQNTGNSKNRQEKQDASATYEKINDGKKFSAEGSFRNERVNSLALNQFELYDQNSDLLSSNQVVNKATTSLNNFGVKTTYIHRTINNDRSWLSHYELGYKLNIREDNTANNYNSVYIPEATPERKIVFDRIYQNGVSSLSNNLTFKLPNFGAAVFGDYKFAGITTGLHTNLQIITNTIKTGVSDMDSLTDQYRANPYLSNNRSETILNMSPALTFAKNIYRGLSNRYEKNFSANITIGLQFYALNSSSEKLFQEFSRAYEKLSPSASINYLNRQFGEFTNSISLKVSTFSQYPSVQQLVPLVDSANLNLIQKGNLHLKEQDTRDLTFMFKHTSERSGNILSWSASLSGGYVKKYFTVSSLIDGLGRTVYSTVNADGYRYLSGSVEFKKAFKWTNNQIQFNVWPLVSIQRSPNFINGVLTYFNNVSLSYNPGISYTHKSWLDLNLVQKQIYNHYSHSSADAINLSNLSSQSAVSLNIICTSHLTIGSNVIYTKNSYNKAELKNFTIWNASINYKFLKGNVGELKLSGLDLLHQNTGITNYGFNNSITQGTANILQQYFMLGFAYYPRKFGK